MLVIDYRQLNPAQQVQLDALEVHPEQRTYAGSVADTLYWLRNAPTGHSCAMVGLVDDVPCALLLLQRAALLPPWAASDAALVCAVQVDRRLQGRGVGTAFMRALPAQVRVLWPQVRRLQLSVDPSNHPAMALYRATGWVHSGNGYRARVGYELQMTLML